MDVKIHCADLHRFLTDRMIDVRGKAGGPGAFSMSHAGAAAAIPPELGGAPREELAYRLRQQRILAGFGLFALGCRGLDELLDAATRLCADGLLTRYCKVLEYLPEQNRFLVRAGVGWHEGVVGQATIGADLEVTGRLRL